MTNTFQLFDYKWHNLPKESLNNFHLQYLDIKFQGSQDYKLDFLDYIHKSNLLDFQHMDMDKMIHNIGQDISNIQ